MKTVGKVASRFNYLKMLFSESLPSFKGSKFQPFQNGCSNKRASVDSECLANNTENTLLVIHSIIHWAAEYKSITVLDSLRKEFLFNKRQKCNNNPFSGHFEASSYFQPFSLFLGFDVRKSCREKLRKPFRGSRTSSPPNLHNFRSSRNCKSA